MSRIQTHELQAYGIAFSAAWVILTCFAVYLCKTRNKLNKAVWIIIAVAFAARLALVFSLSPALSDDIWRYIHDGTTLAQGDNPYALAPAEAGADIENINHPHLVTIYQPTSQYAFAGLAVIGKSDTVFRLSFVCFDLLTILLIIVALREAGRSVWWAALYAWHPLAITEVAWSGHQDAIGVTFMLAALLCAERAVKKPSWGWVSGLCLALCVAVKPIIGPLALPIAWRLRHRPRAILGGVVATTGMLAILYTPFILAPGGIDGMFETIETFIKDWAFNGSVHVLLETTLGEKIYADRAAAVLLGIVLLTVTFASRNLWQAAMIYLLAAVLLSNTVHPWYALWLAALLPMAWCWTGWVFTAAVALSYTALLELEIFKPTPWSWRMEYGMIGLVLIVEIAMRLRTYWRHRHAA